MSKELHRATLNILIILYVEENVLQPLASEDVP